MTAQPLDWEEFYRLVSGWADNELTSSDWQRFSTLMTGSAEAREAYVRYAALHAMLELAHVPPTECGRPPDTSTRMEDVEHPADWPGWRMSPMAGKRGVVAATFKTQAAGRGFGAGLSADYATVRHPRGAHSAAGLDPVSDSFVHEATCLSWPCWYCAA